VRLGTSGRDLDQTLGDDRSFLIGHRGVQLKEFIEQLVRRRSNRLRSGGSRVVDRVLGPDRRDRMLGAGVSDRRPRVRAGRRGRQDR
jgi:hypothetical protein